jgi:hypothetical protein
MNIKGMRELIRMHSWIVAFSVLWLCACSVGKAQIGSGAPQASARVQVQSKVEDQSARRGRIGAKPLTKMRLCYRLCCLIRFSIPILFISLSDPQI